MPAPRDRDRDLDDSWGSSKKASDRRSRDALIRSVRGARSMTTASLVLLLLRNRRPRRHLLPFVLVTIPRPAPEVLATFACPRCTSAARDRIAPQATSTRARRATGSSSARGWCTLVARPELALRSPHDSRARRSPSELVRMLRCPACSREMERGRFGASFQHRHRRVRLARLWLEPERSSPSYPRPLRAACVHAARPRRTRRESGATTPATTSPESSQRPCETHTSMTIWSSRRSGRAPSRVSTRGNAACARAPKGERRARES